MQQSIPIEECAKQRLQILVYAYTLFTKHLMEEGIDREKVKRASDKVWSSLGFQAATQMKPLFGDKINIEAIQLAGSMAESVHGMEVVSKIEGDKIQTDFIKCPWQDVAMDLGMPESWRFCSSGHDTFTKSMYKGLHPNAKYEFIQNMPAGAKVCKAVSSV